MLSLRSAWRTFRRRPGLALFTVATLAIGIGASAAVFTLVDAVLLRELPVHEPDRLVWMWNARAERDRAPFSLPDLTDYQGQNHVLAGLAPFTNWTANLTGAGEAERLEGVRVAPAFFDLLGVDAAYGRVFRSGDDPLDRIAVLTDRLWRRRFGADPSRIGQPIDLNGTRYTVVGVLPAAFVFPFRDADVAVPLPLSSDPRRADRGAGFLRVLARLKPHVTIAVAKADLDAIGKRLQKEYPIDDAKKTGVNLFPLQAELVGDSRQLLLTLFGGVGLLLLVACANLTSLFAVALSTRRGELRTRRALGASRGHLVAQLLSEIGSLSAIGGLLGALSSVWLVRALVWWAGRSLPRLAEVSVDRFTLAFTAGVTVVAALACGLLPALEATAKLSIGADESARAATASVARQRFCRTFVALQIAASLVLLVAVGLTSRSFVNLQRSDPGFRADGVLSVQLSLPPSRYATVDALNAFADRLRPGLARIPAVEDVSAISLLPLSGLLRTEDFRIIGRPAPPPDEVPQAHLRIVLPRYFRTLGIPIVSGREFSDDDREHASPVAVVGRTFANRFWPGTSPLGAHVRMGYGATVEIVGIASDVKQFTLDGSPTADLYVPLRQMPASDAPFVAGRMYWVVRTSADPLTIATEVRRGIQALDGDIATSSAVTLPQIVAEALRVRRFNVTLLGLFGELALLLAAIGAYAVTAFAVSRRTREIGVRVAFGATRTDVLRLVLGSELRAVAAGLIAGTIVALPVAHAMTHTLFEVDAFDPWTFNVAAAALAAVATLGSYVPARRALALDPAAALRTL